MSSNKILALLLPLWLSAACAEPCVQLTETVCECKSNQPERNLCNEQVRLARAAKDEVTEEESAACEALLEGCSCEALARGDLHACGLAP